MLRNDQGQTVHFKNGTAVRDVDAIVYATGYRSEGSFDGFVEPSLRLSMDQRKFHSTNTDIPTESWDPRLDPDTWGNIHFPGQLHLDVLFHANPRLFYMAHNDLINTYANLDAKIYCVASTREDVLLIVGKYVESPCNSACVSSC